MRECSSPAGWNNNVSNCSLVQQSLWIPLHDQGSNHELGHAGIEIAWVGCQRRSSQAVLVLTLNAVQPASRTNTLCISKSITASQHRFTRMYHSTVHGAKTPYLQAMLCRLESLTGALWACLRHAVKPLLSVCQHACLNQFLICIAVLKLGLAASKTTLAATINMMALVYSSCPENPIQAPISPSVPCLP